jgi:hypothetical protein
LAEIVSADAQALRRKEVDWIVQRGVYPLAGRQLCLGGRDQLRRLLQLQKIGSYTAREDNIAHGRLLACVFKSLSGDNELLGLMEG